MRIDDLSIRTKLIGLLVGLCATVLVVACACFVHYDRTSTSAAKEQTLTVLADAIAGSAVGPVAFQDAESARYVLKTLDAEPTAVYAGLYVSEFETGALTRLTSWGREGGPEAPDSIEEVASHLGYHHNTLYLLRPIKSEDAEVGQLVMAFTTDDIQARSQQQLLIALLILVVSVIGALLAASRVHRVISSPIDTLVVAARRVRKDGDYSVRVDLDRRDELGVLADGFNAMLADIQSRDAELNAHREHLEELVAERTRDLDRRNEAMRLVLDNVDQGLVTLAPDGAVSSERSARFDDWFGAPPEEGIILSEQLGKLSPSFGEWLGLCWESVSDGFLPVELALDQLPKEAVLGERHCSFRYKAIEEGEDLSSVLLIVSDTTAEVARKREEERQRQIIAALQAVSQDRQGFFEFIDDAESILEALDTPQTETLLKRRLHTLKGNSALIGLAAIAREVHLLEEALEERALEAAEIEGIRASWDALKGQIQSMGSPPSDALLLHPSELKEVSELVAQRAPHAIIAHHLRRLSDEPTAARLGRFARQAESVSRRLGHSSLNVIIEDNGVRLPREPLAEVWGAFGHVIRNAVDHGIGTPEDRVACGRPEAGTVTLRTRLVRGADVPDTPWRFGARVDADTALCLLEIEDDGRGIDWDRISAMAKKNGFSVVTPTEKLAALFSDGLSTREQVSEISGRGVGTSVIADAVVSMGGVITVRTRLGEGTCFSLWIPIPERNDWIREDSASAVA